MKLFFALLWLLHWLPLSVIGAISRALGHLLYYAAISRRRVGLNNLARCFPAMKEAERKRLLKRHFGHMAQLLLEYGVCWWASPERIKRLVRIHHLERLTELRAAGEDVIIFYPHFVGFELAALRLNLEMPLVSVYSHQKNQAMDKMIYAGRNRFDNAFIVSRQESLRAIIKAMRADHAPFLYLPDQDFGRRDSIFVPFFGVQAATVPGLSRIAGLARARVVPVIPRRVAGGLEVDVYPAWDNFPSGDIEADTRRMNEFLEQRVLEMPEQYFWLHKRFKTRPEGEPPFYHK
ncbi:lipid A biosynthesis lauroyl acyltransferase [Crenobacter intestini]|uniref:Lipid A biosynthesis lauroyl acyltransferase n=1 Tax=Crenobacter intestini TaxID=2563443 RepID=A0A4T0UZP4_9NEIS|nr:lipid A biosynthesis lauroyl acyltransferase [Crenobacter intestini]TIC84702.1 lipid A biosynthesis lauroyl acyltransferase [Crenobacter intestini]